MSKIMISFVAGAMFGILFAPRKGSKTRRKIADMATKFKDNLTTAVDNVTDAVDSLRPQTDDSTESYENLEGRAQQLMS